MRRNVYSFGEGSVEDASGCDGRRGSGGTTPYGA
ncbi:hypothetical protein LINPERPRIM_LOCUS14822, partial [Linum perenne]